MNLLRRFRFRFGESWDGKGCFLLVAVSIIVALAFICAVITLKSKGG